MIKKFKEFNSEDIKNNEINYYERELNARKKEKENILEKDGVYFDEIVNEISYEIDNNIKYHLTLNKDDFGDLYIQYESDNEGRIKIFKPKDNSYKGFFEVNGRKFESDANSIRNFYHKLNQIIKKEPMVNEGLRDKMLPKSYDEIKKNTRNLNPDQKILFGAKHGGLIWLIKEGIEEGGNINQLEGTPLQLAVGNNDMETLKFLIDNGADYNIASGYAVRYSAEFNQIEMLEYLVNLGADIHSYFNYAFDVSIADGNFKVVEILTNSKKFDKKHLPKLIKLCKDFNQNLILKYLINKFNI